MMIPQDEELIFERIIQMPMQNDAEDDSRDVDEEEEEDATQTHTCTTHKKAKSTNTTDV